MESHNKISWSAPRDFYFEKTPLWFTIAIAVAIVFNVGAIITKNILTIIVFILATVMFFVHETRDPEEIKISLDERGITAGKNFYQYADLESFWIFYDPPFNYISVKSKKSFIPYIKILLEDQNPVTIRHYLMEHIPEKKQKEGFIEIIERILRI